LVETTVVPRLRGVFHQYAFIGAIAAGTVLVVLADGVLERLAVWVYAAALAAMFGASALYHRFPWRTAAARLRARRVDHAMIFVFIAGTYTPFALLGFGGLLGMAVLAIVWCGAAIGSAVELVWIEAPRWVSAVAYVALGWAGIVVIPSLFPALGVAPAVLALGGGAVYTLGAVAYAAAWPDPFPGIFGFHEVFHLLVIAAAVAQYIAVSLVVI
jgi:hemolysin III